MYCKKCGEYSGKYPLCNKCYYEEDEDFDEEYEDEDFDEEDTCEICGEDSNGYPLCKTCYYKVKEYAEENFETISKIEKRYCLFCNNTTDNEYFLCPDCYKKHRNKETIFSLLNGQNLTILQSKYYCKYKCDDGHWVKSKAERDIDNYLFKNKIRHCYEKELPIDNNPEHSLYPDFYLPDFNLYIEHLGMEDNKKYNDTLEYKIPIYKKLKITLICTHEKTDAADIADVLKRKLKFYKKHQINYLKE